jgi:hypothetical protein
MQVSHIIKSRKTTNTHANPPSAILAIVVNPAQDWTFLGASVDGRGRD